MNYKLIATQVGDCLKYNTTNNQINRTGRAIFNFNCEDFPNDSITSERAKLIYDWIMTAAKTEMNPDERKEKIVQFCEQLSSDELKIKVLGILKNSGLNLNLFTSQISQIINDFNQRNFHSEVHKHCQKLFVEENYFHAVFEGCKAYNKLVREKSRSDKDGSGLMLSVLDPKKGVLKVNKCESETDLNVQDGTKFLSAGLMQAVRNPTAHEPAVDWSINKEDCLNLLIFLSYLFSQIEKATYWNSN